MGFKFNLETVLKHRKRLEEFAQREYAEAQAAVDECLRRIEAMYLRSDEVREEILSAQKAGNQVESIRAMEEFLQGQKIRIETLRQHARVLLQTAEEKQEALITAAQNKKMLVKLKEKKKIAYQDWLKSVEQKEQDDMTSVRYAWGKK